jgi:hypothetical protein
MNPTAVSTRSFWATWRGAALAGCVVFWVWLWALCHPGFWVAIGIGEPQRPFLDLYGLLGACDAVRVGVDPFTPNDFDPYHRPHVYSTWWFALGALGLGRSDTAWLGLFLAGGMVVTASVMARPRTASEGCDFLLLLLSPAFLLAFYRANYDSVIFVLISAALLCFRQSAPWWRGMSVVLLAVATVLKSYPIVTLVVLADLNSRRKLAAGLVLFAAVLMMAWSSMVPGLESAAKYFPTPQWLYAYGAPVLLRNLGISGAGWWVVPTILLAIWAAFSAIRNSDQRCPEGMESGSAAEREFMAGAAIIVGTFFLGASYVYKLIAAVWLLPWLWRGNGAAGEGRHWRTTIRYLLLTVVWLEGGMALLINLGVMHWSEGAALVLLKVTLVISQLLTWMLVACLLRFLFNYLWRRGRAFLFAPG